MEMTHERHARAKNFCHIQPWMIEERARNFHQYRLRMSGYHARGRNDRPARKSQWHRQPPKPGSPKDLRARTAQETMDLLPDLISSLKNQPLDSSCISSSAELDASQCPGLDPATVHVINGDTLDVAISHITPVRTSKPPIILNMASEKSPGGGWLNGSMAQEEAVCYRSSLSATLHKRFYPMTLDQAIYSPEIIVVREALDNGHKLLDLTAPDDLPVIAVISVAALRRPQLGARTNSNDKITECYARPQDEETMKKKMRLILRVAGVNGHTKLILGALGCGAFHNPRHEVMRLWKEVLQETEWKGWFAAIIFAVLDTRNEGNYDTFRDGLEGLTV